MNIKHLNFVKAVSEKKSFSAAAKLCNVTQPTLSNGVSKLEEDLGERIFERSTRSVELTLFGEKILPSVKAILDLEDSIYLSSKEFTNPKTHLFKIGFSPLLNSKFISMLTKTYTENSNNQKVLLIEQNVENLETKFNDGELDIIFVPHIGTKKVKNSIPLYHEELVYIENGLTKNQRVSLSDIRDKTFLMVPDTCGLSYVVRNLVSSTQKSIKEYEGLAMSYQVLAEWASSGLGSTILPISKIPHDINFSKINVKKKDASIGFIARWKSQDLSRLRPLIHHFKENSVNIYEGLQH